MTDEDDVFLSPLNNDFRWQVLVEVRRFFGGLSFGQVAGAVQKAERELMAMGPDGPLGRYSDNLDWRVALAEQATKVIQEGRL